MKAILFCRVSSKEQEDTGFSLPAQEKLLTEYANKKNLEIERVFSISESASGKTQRQMFFEMMDFIEKKGIRIIICEKADRLTRNFKDMVAIDEWLDKDPERQIHLVKDSLILTCNSRSQEKLNWGIRILFAKNYIDNLSEEVKKGLAEKIEQGWLPTKPPTGYKTLGEKGHKIHVLDDAVAPFVVKMFELYASGDYSLSALTDKMYSIGLRSRSGRRITKSRIHVLLTDPFYIGKIRWNDKIFPGKQEPLISEEVFNTVHQILTGRNTPKYSKHNFLYRGLIRCAECSGTITWETQKGHIYGHCNHYRNCQQQSWTEENVVDHQLLQGFNKLEIQNEHIVNWLREALRQSHKDEIKYYESSVGALNKNLGIIQNRIDRIYDEKLDGAIDKDTYDRRFYEYSSERQRLLQEINKNANANDKYFELGSNIYELSQNAQAIYQNAKDIDMKHKLIRLVFDNLSLNEGKLTYTYTLPFKLLSSIVEVLNGSKLTENQLIGSKIFEPDKEIVKSTKKDDIGSCRPILLPLKDLFCNHKLEFNFSLSELKNSFELLGFQLDKTTPAFLISR